MQRVCKGALYTDSILRVSFIYSISMTFRYFLYSVIHQFTGYHLSKKANGKKVDRVRQKLLKQ